MNTNRLIRATLLMFLVVGVSMLFLTAIASAAPSLVPTPKHLLQDDTTVITLTGADPGQTEIGGEIAVWDPPANPAIFPDQGCNAFPDPSGGAKWRLVNSSNVTVTYTLPNLGTITIVDFGDGGPVSVTPAGGATVSPGGPYRWVQVDDGNVLNVENDNTSTLGVYVVATCGAVGTLPFTASDTFEVHEASTNLTKTASADKVLVGDTVTYTYNETNDGDLTFGLPLKNASVEDASCPTSPLTTPVSGDDGDGILEPGETWVFTCDVTLNTPGTVTNTAYGHGIPFDGVIEFPDLTHPDLGGTDPDEKAEATVRVINPAIDLTKTPDQDKVLNNTEVVYTFNVTNTGDTNLTNVSVTDSNLGTITSGQTLNVSETKTFTASEVLTANKTNTATATGNHQLGTVSDTAEATVRVINPAITVTKECTPETQPAPGTITWKIVVNNTGDVPLDVNVTDSQHGVVFTGILPPGGSNETTITDSNLAAGTYTNTVTAVGEHQLGEVTATSSATCNVEGVGGEGCTPGFWKNNADKKGATSWVPTGYTPDQTLASAGFINANGVDVTQYTLLQALSFKGGSNLEGAEQILLRAAVAALLNAASPDVDYPLSVAEVIDQVNDALATDDRDMILALATELDENNNLFCPIDQSGAPVSNS